MGKVWKSCEIIAWKKCGKYLEKNEKKFVEKMGKKWGNKVRGKCEKPKNEKNVKNSREIFLGKNVEKICVEKTWINDLEEVKSVEKC